MSARKGLMPYPQGRALEHTAYGLGVVPTRIHPVLLPVWCIEVEADVTEGEPYGLIDRYLERGIAEGGLGSAEELAAFFALEPSVVGQALRFLSRIGHLTEVGGRLGLTELGHRSVRDQVRYTHTLRDRRKLYFDAFTCTPLTRAYYDVRKVSFVSGADLAEASGRRDGPRHRVLSAFRGFRLEALTELANHPDRDRYNLPERIDNPRSLGNDEQVFLPAYLVRAVERGGRARHLVYTPADDRADEELSAACGAAPAVLSALEAAEADADVQEFRKQAGRWLSRKSLAEYQPVRLGNGAWRVTLPGECFGHDHALPLTRLGSFVVLGSDFFQVWCEDERARKRAMIERTDTYLGSRSRVDQDAVQQWITRTARQLGLGPVSVDDLLRGATRMGRKALARQLSTLSVGR